MPAVGYEHSRGPLEVIMPLSTLAVFLQLRRTETGRCHPDPTFTCAYNFGTLSLICENSLSHPALCFVLSEQTERYSITFGPGAKTDDKMVHQLP